MAKRHLTHALMLLPLACGPGGGASEGSDDGDGSATTSGLDAGATDAPTSSSSSGSSSTDDESTTNTTNTGQPSDGVGPQATAWEVVVDDLPFPLADIHSLTIGRTEFNNNFANRGDVEVLFDRDSEVITVEMRKYDFADHATSFGDPAIDLVGTFARLRPWAYNANIAAPEKPNQMDPASDCLQGAWKDGCALYLYYDGQAQPLRSGADFRVHLPKAYRGELHVETEDNLNESAYPRRGDVVVTGDGDAGWCGGGSVELSAGRAGVRMCRDLSPAPTCPPDQVAACAEFVDEMGEPAAWSPDCPCSAALFGQARVESRAPWGADITVDVPAGTWLNASAANTSDDKPHDCQPAIESCGGDCEMTEDAEFSKSAEFSYPGPAAISGAGYNLLARSAGCAEVDFFADEYAPWDPADPPTSELRGHVTVCTGCL
ncbi:MAG: hypothetical protein JNL82_23590 [Myxococcales bacterium]|nr:hypothetical protein [Myxococcales bacterium]